MHACISSLIVLPNVCIHSNQFFLDIILYILKYGNKCRFHFRSLNHVDLKLVIFLVLIFLFLLDEFVGCIFFLFHFVQVINWKAATAANTATIVVVVAVATVVAKTQIVFADNYGKFSILPIATALLGCVSHSLSLSLCHVKRTIFTADF